MPTHRLMRVLAARLDEMAQSGRLKGRESVICGVVPGRDVYGPRYLIEGEGDTPFLRMNSNNYLGMTLRSEMIEAEERAATAYGAGPGAVRSPKLASRIVMRYSKNLPSSINRDDRLAIENP
jgi:glycine C-acetyltransferase